MSYRDGEESNRATLRQYVRSFVLPKHGSQLRLPVGIDRRLAFGWKSAAVSIKSVQLWLSFEGGQTALVNWRSPHFVVTFDSNSSGAALSGDAFVSRPERAVISYVSVENSNGAQELRLFPRPLNSVGVLSGALPLYAKIVTRESLRCPRGTPLVLKMKAEVSASGSLLTADKSFHTRLGQATVININRWLEQTPNDHAKAQWIRFSAVSADVSAPCSAHETIGVPHVVILRNGAELSFLPGTQALTITDVK